MGRHKALRQLQLPSEVLPFARGDVAELERADPKSGAGSERFERAGPETPVLYGQGHLLHVGSVPLKTFFSKR